MHKCLLTLVQNVSWVNYTNTWNIRWGMIHNYTHVACNYETLWSKPVCIKKALEKCEYVMFIDSDALIPHSLKTDLFFYHSKDHDITFTLGGYLVDHYDNSINTGWMYFLNSHHTMHFLNLWMNRNNGQCKNTRWESEQDCAYKLVKEYKKTYNIHVINSSETRFHKYVDIFSTKNRMKHLQSCMKSNYTLCHSAGFRFYCKHHSFYKENINDCAHRQRNSFFKSFFNDQVIRLIN